MLQQTITPPSAGGPGNVPPRGGRSQTPWDRFVEDDPGSLDALSAPGIADAARLRERLRLNRAVAKASLLSTADKQIVLQRIVEGDDMLPFYVLELGARLGRAVCKLAFDDEMDGTGFLIAPDILVTNNHVLPDAARARQARCVFDYQLNLDLKPQETVTYTLDPDALFITSDALTGLDYTFVRIDPAAGTRYPPIPASRGSFTNLEQECANIVQHPGGKMKRVALRENRILVDSGVTLRYVADTDGGSSGSPVFNSSWQLIGLHHAARSIVGAIADQLKASHPGVLLRNMINEGIKFSAIAADLERLAQGRTGAAAREVLRAFRDTDTLLGYFGGLGRPAGGGTTFNKVVTTYSGDAHDTDIGFWNLEWFGPRYRDKVDAIAKIVTDLALDVYVLANIAPEAIQFLAEHLSRQYGMDFRWAPAGAEDPSARKTTIVMWNALTVEPLAVAWPDAVRPWFGVNLRDLKGDRAEAVEGKVFDRFPTLFRFRSLQRDGVGDPFVFNLVPLHLSALGEGAFRREEAAKILSVAIAEIIADSDTVDWVVGGDFNAGLFTGQISALTTTVLPVSAEDEDGGAMSYLKGPKSLIEHIFVSPNLAKSYGAKDYLVAAADAVTPDRVKEVSDHRPVLIRLSLTAEARDTAPQDALPDGLAAALTRLAA